MTKTALKVWIGIGTVSLLALLILPPILARMASEDIKRYRECIAGTRSDCDRSMVWNLADAIVLLQIQTGGSLAGTPYEGLEQGSPSGATRTSEKAPFIIKVEPRGMSNANGTYFAPAGTRVTFLATMTGMITNADLYVVQVVDSEIKRPEKVAPFEKKEGDSWEAVYTIPPGFDGSVEVRAYGVDPKDLAVLALPVAAR
ncbi:hypothetical protein EDM68_04615 [Candidatus Uhrbacteria bacterium]|nr:MAG: hypothetical protein EDM68_04615 [Candidatus Uhrbacteria bacterium]